MRISDWSSDVCSSDLRSDPSSPYLYFVEEPPQAPIFIGQPPEPSEAIVARGKEVWQQAKCWECHGQTGEIGRASCRERVCQYVYISVVADSLTKKDKEYTY